MKEVTLKLEVALGPDTGDLDLRTGIHSQHGGLPCGLPFATNFQWSSYRGCAPWGTKSLSAVR
eukprot:scaffold13586_cov186-Cylindrotheca_fusiformis.AAC.1